MPARKIPLISGEWYHVFNRGINRQPIFQVKGDYLRAILTLNFYKTISTPLKLSYFLAKSKEEQGLINHDLNHQPTRVTILSFCFMPNHFHLLLKQNQENGISKYLADFQNSYTKYFNAKHNRQSSLLDRQFKSVHVETGEQLLHLVRYIILNPYSSGILRQPKESLAYPNSYINQDILEETTGVTKSKFTEFVLDQAEYQRELEKLKHLIIDKN